MKTKQYLLPLLLAGVSNMPAAMTNETDRFHFTPIGLIAGQTIRLAVTNLFPTDPCRVTLRFTDSAGLPVLTTDSQQVTSTVSVAPNSIATLDYAAPASATGVAGRVSVRPAVDRLSTTCIVQSSAQAFDGSDLTAMALPQMPLLPPIPVLPAAPVLGAFRLGDSQLARLSVIDIRAIPNDPCRVSLSFLNGQEQAVVNADGNPITSEVQIGNAGSTAFLDVRGSGSALGMIRPVVRRVSTATPSSRCRFIAGVELMDGTSGADHNGLAAKSSAAYR